MPIDKATIDLLDKSIMLLMARAMRDEATELEDIVRDLIKVADTLSSNTVPKWKGEE